MTSRERKFALSGSTADPRQQCKALLIPLGQRLLEEGLQRIIAADALRMLPEHSHPRACSARRDEKHIYPCVDIGVGDILEDGSLLIVGSVAGYAPRPFGLNWTGRMGWFVHAVGQPFLNRVAGKDTKWSVEGTFSYIIPDMKKL